jgi:hypothetical protein
MSNVTLVGIDGLGKAVDFYIKIFELCNREFKVEKNLLFTSATHRTVDIFNDIEIDFIQIPKLNYKEFNEFCLTSINEFIDTTHIITVQTDGFICNGDMWKDEYFEYDYVGQPWLNPDGKTFTNFPWVNSYEKSVGEGGFTLRSKKLLEALSNIDINFIKNCINSGANEDVFISSYVRDYLESEGCRFATPEIGMEFCAGIRDSNRLNTSFGFHTQTYVEEVLKRYEKKYSEDYREFIFDYKA